MNLWNEIQITHKILYYCEKKQVEITIHFSMAALHVLTVYSYGDLFHTVLCIQEIKVTKMTMRDLYEVIKFLISQSHKSLGPDIKVETPV